MNSSSWAGLDNLFSLGDEKADLEPVLLPKKNKRVVPTLAGGNKVECTLVVVYGLHFRAD